MLKICTNQQQQCTDNRIPAAQTKHAVDQKIGFLGRKCVVLSVIMIVSDGAINKSEISQLSLHSAEADPSKESMQLRQNAQSTRKC